MQKSSGKKVADVQMNVNKTTTTPKVTASLTRKYSNDREGPQLERGGEIVVEQKHRPEYAKKRM